MTLKKGESLPRKGSHLALYMFKTHEKQNTLAIDGYSGAELIMKHDGSEDEEIYSL